MCAVGGLARPGDMTEGGLICSEPVVLPVVLVLMLRVVSVGTKPWGESRRRAAPGHPHS